MHTRIKELRQSLKLTQKEFASKLCVTRSTVATWETVENVISNRSIINMCKEFNVNENWLRTGEGKMFKDLDRNEQIAKFIYNLQLSADDSFKKRLINALIELNEDQWELLADMSLKLYQEQFKDSSNKKSDN